MILQTLAAIVFTLPSTGQHTWKTFDPDLGDSTTNVECMGTVPINGLLTARLYWSSVTGGGYYLRDEHSVVGREGQSDTFYVDVGPGGHAYVTTTNAIGESCAGNEIYLPGTQITGIETEPPASKTPEYEWFDLQGRKVTAPEASAIYFRRIIGEKKAKKVVHFR